MAASNAIITVDEYLSFSGDDTDEQNVDRDQIERLIDAVSTFIEGYLRRKIVQTTDDAVTEYIYGHEGPSYMAKEGRINTLTSLSYQDTVSSSDGSISWQLMTTADYPRMVTQDSGTFEFVNGHVFTPGQRYKFVYTTGWASKDVPVPIKLTGVMLVKRILKTMDDKEGVTSKSIGDQTTSFDLAKIMTDRHRELLRPFKVWA